MVLCPVLSPRFPPPRLRLLPGKQHTPEGASYPRRLLLEILVEHHEKRRSQLDAVNHMPLYPDENVLWDENLVPLGHYHGNTVLALPKLNLQFLTFHDYLLRSFNLFRLESAYEIREDLVDAIKRAAPRLTTDYSRGGHGQEGTKTHCR